MCVFIADDAIVVYFQESVEVESLGHTLSGPQIDSGGELVLRYLNGSNCTTNDGTETHFSATVHFRCKKGALVRKDTMKNIYHSNIVKY